MIRAVALVCTLTPSPAPSSSHHLAGQVMSELADLGVQGETIRVGDHNVRPGIARDNAVALVVVPPVVQGDDDRRAAAAGGFAWGFA
ncbi:hypothetical protein ACIRRY_51480, partial [Streptomyces sp. NPDC101776]